MKFKFVEEDVEVLDTPSGWDKNKKWVYATYKTLKPGQFVELGLLPQWAAISVNGRAAYAANQHTNNRHIIDVEAEEVHLIPVSTQVEYLGKGRPPGLPVGQAVRVMNPSKFAGQIYFVAKTGYSRIQLVFPGKDRVILDNQYLARIEVDVTERLT